MSKNFEKKNRRLKKKSIKILAVALAVFMLSIVAFPAFAVGSPSIAINDTSVNLGSTFTLPLIIGNAGEIAGGSLKLTFNPEFISAQSVASGDFGTPTYNIGSGFLYISIAGTSAIGKNSATLALVTFKGEKTGSTSLKIEDAYLNKEDGSLVDPSIQNGTITVGSPGTAIPQIKSSPVAASHSSVGQIETDRTSNQINQSKGEKPVVQNISEKLPVSTEEKTGNPKLEQVLYELAHSKDPLTFSREKGITMTGDKVRVIIMLANGGNISGRFNISIEEKDKNFIQALVPVSELLEMTGEPGINYIKLPEDYVPATGGKPKQTSFPSIISWLAIMMVSYLIKKGRKK